jgi:3-methyladenine DNA glycosylase AlkD
MHPYIESLRVILQADADPIRAVGAKAYMRNQFEFFGIPMPVRRTLCRQYIKQSLPPYAEIEVILKELFAQPERELHYFAIELLAAMKKQWTKEIISIMEDLIVTKSWWDTVDYMASVWTAPYFMKYPDRIASVTGRWNRSEDMWLQRSSLLFQLKYKKDMDTDLLSRYIDHLSSSKEFFIQKAIGWCLREYSKTEPAWVKKFVATHSLAPLSKREALKRIDT